MELLPLTDQWGGINDEKSPISAKTLKDVKREYIYIYSKTGRLASE